MLPNITKREKAVLCIMGKDVCINYFIHEQLEVLLAMSSVLMTQASWLVLKSTHHRLKSPEEVF